MTGAAGFIGHHFIHNLKKNGFSVIALDNFSRGNSSNITSDIDEIMQVDITSAIQLKGRFSGIDSVVHLAAVNGTKNFYENPKKVFEVGLLGTYNIIQECIRSKVKNLIFASSAEVYGNPLKVPTSESDSFMVSTLYSPRYSYGGSKLIGELMMNYWAKEELERVISFRPHNVYGERMGLDHVIPRVIKTLLDKTNLNLGKGAKVDLEIQGDGSEVRSFCYIDDIVNGIQLLLTKGESGDVFHLGNPEPVTILDLVILIANKLEVSLNLSFGPRLAGSPTVRIPDIEKAQRIGFEPKIPLTEGLDRLISSMTADFK